MSKNIVVDGEKQPWDPESLRVALSAYETLVLVAHGENAHCNLEPLVLCGAIDGAETVDGRVVEGGCVENEYCKRAAGHGLRLVPVTEVHAENVVLLSCNGGTATGKLYPSNASIVAALSRPGRTIFTTTMPLGVGPQTIPTFGKFAGTHSTWADLAKALDAEHALPGLFQVVRTGASDQLPNFDGTYLDSAEQSLAPFDAHGAGLRLAQASLAQEYLQRAAISDPDLAARSGGLVVRAQERLFEASVLTHAVMGRELSQRLDSSSIPSAVAPAFQERSTGWAEDVMGTLSALPRLANGIMSYGLERGERVASGRCTRCGDHCHETALKALTGQKLSVRRDCPTCGVLRIEHVDAPHFDIEVPYTTEPDVDIPVTATVEDFTSALGVPWQLLLVLKDKSNGKVAYSRTFTVGTGTMRVMIPRSVTSQLAADLHTLTATGLFGFRVVHVRKRMSRT